MQKHILLVIISCLPALFGMAQTPDNPSYMLDSTFSSNGKALIKRINAEPYALAETKSLVVLLNGSIVAGGDVETAHSQYDYFLTRAR